MGLGYLGLRENKKAQEQFNQVLTLDINHQGARTHNQMSYDRGFFTTKNFSQPVNGDLKQSLDKKYKPD
jgi:hypothetical protein